VTVRFNRRPRSGCRASSLAKFRRALAGEHVGSINGCCPIIAQRLIFLAIKISRISGRACIFRFLPAELAPKPGFAMIQPSARRDSELLFPATMVILSVSQIDPACLNRQNSALRKGFESSGIVPERYCKAPDRSLDRPCGLLTRVFPPALRAAAGLGLPARFRVLLRNYISQCPAQDFR
jgi:hypothetical protein